MTTEENGEYLRLVSWNMGGAVFGGNPQWEYLLADHSIDVGLLQEAPNPWKLDTETVPAAGQYWKTETSGQFRARTAVTRLSERVTVTEVPTAAMSYAGWNDLAVSRVGTVTAAEVTVAATEEQITVISVYGLWERPVPWQSLIYADASMHRILSDISVLVTGQDRPVVLAGDFNVVRGLRDPTDGEQWWRRNEGVFRRLEDLGFTFVGPQTPDGVAASDAPPGQASDSQAVVTHRPRLDDPASGRYQLDYVYVTHDLAERTQTRALNDGDEWGPSDHCQVHIDIAEPTEPIWNKTTFATSVERRHGPVTRATVEHMIRWAEGHRLRVEFGDGEPGQVWFQSGDGPEGLQYTFSVKTDGRVIVQFEHLRPPYRTVESREPIRQRLNELPGVDITEDRLNGRPAVPIAALSDPQVLERFLAAFDNLLDRTRQAETGPASP